MDFRPFFVSMRDLVHGSFWADRSGDRGPDDVSLRIDDVVHYVLNGAGEREMRGNRSGLLLFLRTSTENKNRTKRANHKISVHFTPSKTKLAKLRQPKEPDPRSPETTE